MHVYIFYLTAYICLIVNAVNRAPPPAPVQGGGGGSMLGGLGSTIAQGMCRNFEVGVSDCGVYLCISTSLSYSLFNIIIGMAFGTGSAVAHRAVDAIVGPRTIQHETVASEGGAAPSPMTNNIGGADACGFHSKAFQDVCATSLLLQFFLTNDYMG